MRSLRAGRDRWPARSCHPPASARRCCASAFSSFGAGSGATMPTVATCAARREAFSGITGAVASTVWATRRGLLSCDARWNVCLDAVREGAFKTWLFRAATGLRLPAVAEAWARGVPILGYHGVTASPASPLSNIRRLHVPAQRFEEHLRV